MESPNMAYLIQEVRKSNQLLEEIVVSLHSKESLKELEAKDQGFGNLAEITSGNITPNQSIAVLAKFEVLKIGKIDTKAQQFDAKVSFTLTWHADFDRSSADLPYGKISESSLKWKPEVVISNMVGTPETATVNVWRKRVPSSMGGAGGGSQIVLTRVFQATFAERMELNDFPLDVQDLTITLKSCRKEVVLYEDPNERSVVHGESFYDSQQWKLSTVMKVVSGRPDAEERMNQGNMLSGSFKVARMPGYYITNVCLSMCVLVSLSFCSFAIPPDWAMSRMGNTLTLLLTTVAFKTLISSSLPTISYLTLLDFYLLFEMMYLAFMEVMYALLSFVPPNQADTVDIISFVILATVQVTAHAIFAFIYYMKIKARETVLKGTVVVHKPSHSVT